MKKNNVKTCKASVIIEKDENGYYAFCPDLEGCQTQAESIEEAIKNIKEAIELYLGTLSKKERKKYLSKEILTATLEVKIA